jgi:hypothetical protein
VLPAQQQQLLLGRSLHAPSEQQHKRTSGEKAFAQVGMSIINAVRRGLPCIKSKGLMVAAGRGLSGTFVVGSRGKDCDVRVEL